MKRLALLGALGVASSCTFFSIGNVCGYGDGGCAVAPDAGPRDAGSDAGGWPDGGDAGVGAGDAGQDAGPDAGQDAGPTCPADAGGGAAPLQLGPSAATCTVDTAPSQIIYVDAANGSDANDGGLGHAKQTITAAINAAAAAGYASPAAEIRVCSGTYSEAVVLNTPISLKGGYNCADGGRPALCFDPAFADAGYFRPDAPAGTTSITAPFGVSPTLSLDGTSQLIPKVVSLDGFRIVGAFDGGSSQAVRVLGAVEAEISNNSISGGTGVGSGYAGDIAAIGVLVKEDAGSPEIHHNFISGGSATTHGASYAGSAGIYLLDGAQAFIHDNRIEGGNSVSDMSATNDEQAVSAAIFTLDSNPLTVAAMTPIEFNSLYGGRGSTHSTLGVQVTAGIVVSWGASHSFDVIGNIIEGGDVVSGLTAANQGPKGAVAISSRVGGDCCPGQICNCHPQFQIVGNKIYGGDSAAGAPVTALALSGYAASYIVANNMIHAGGALESNTAVRTAVDFAQVTSATISGNTLYAGGGTASEGIAVRVEDDPGYSQHQLSLEGNILAGNGTNSLGLQFQSQACPASGVLSELQNNLFFNHDLGAAGYATGAQCWTGGAYQLEKLDAALAAQNPVGLYQGNLVFRSSCTDPGCVTRPGICDGTTLGTVACLQDVFLGWDAASYGLNNLYEVAGWSLNPHPSASPGLPACSVTLGAEPLQPNVPWITDIFGNARSLSGTTMGAAVLTACCQ